jgi:16S rRNA (guanine527-N7)-methyltransferase
MAQPVQFLNIQSSKDMSELLTQHQQEFEKLWELFSDWNSKINLSAIRERDDVFEKHFEDSLLITQFFDLNEKKVLDLGAGGGFPTLPLAIATTAHITCLDSVGKKMKAVADMAQQLKLNNVKTMHGRFEDFAHMRNYREQYDIVTARAVAPWNVLLEYALPFVKIGGSFIAYQGPAIVDELINFSGLEKKLGGEIVRRGQAILGESERYFIEVQKVKPTLKIYPRGNGVPRNNPLV